MYKKAELKKSSLFVMVLVAFFMIVGVFCIPQKVYAMTVDEGTFSETVHWKYEDNGKLTFSGGGAIASDDGAYPWSAYASEVTSIEFNGDITAIGNKCFAGCSSLTTVTIPNSVESMGSAVFTGCASLQEITLPFVGSSRSANKSTDAVLGYVFGSDNYSGASQIEQKITDTIKANYYIPSSLKTVEITDAEQMPYGAFSGCHYLTDIRLPDNLKSIEKAAFSGCWYITSIEFPEGLTSINGYAFRGCSRLERLSIPNSIQNIGEYAFFNCDAINTVTLPFIGSSRTATGTEEIKFNYIFGNQYTVGTTMEVVVYHGAPEQLRTVTVTDTKQLPAGAFSGCSRIETVNLPSDLQTIGANAFQKCGITSISIPDTVNSIGDNAFEECTKLTSITIPNSITSLGCAMFGKCQNLQSITVPFIGRTRFSKDSEESVLGYLFEQSSYTDGVATTQYYDQGNCKTYYLPAALNTVTVTDASQLSYGAFYGCTGLTTIRLAGEMSTIGASTFRGSTGLRSIYFDGGIGQIGNSAFYQCTSLEKVYANSWETWNGIDFKNPYANPMAYADNLYINGVLVGNELVIPSGVTKIGDYAYYHFTNLTSVVIPDSVRTIGKYAFAECVNLTSVTMPESVTRIGEGAFENCNQITANMLLDFSYAEAEKTLTYGDTFTPTISYTPNDALLGRNLAWTSSDDSVATVDEEGTVTSVGAGNTVITATSAGLEKSYSITVNKADPNYAVPTGLTSTCKKALSSVELPEGFAWMTPSANVGTAGNHVFKVIYTPEDTSNYNIIDNIDVTVAVEHEYSESWSNNASTHWHECVCGDKSEEADHTYGDWTTLEEPTCTEEGLKEHKCTVCGFAETASIDAAGHDWFENPTIDQAPTCTGEGAQSTHCKNCDATKDSAVVDALGHAYGANVVSPTCTQAGYTLHICGRCGDSYTDTEVEAPGHAFGEWTTDTDSTCTAKGVKTRACTVCGYQETGEIDLKEHNWESDYTVDKEATCTTDGSKSVHCADCAATKDSTVIPTTGHEYGDWITETEPTCTSVGLAKRTCEVCDAEESLVLAAKGHDWKEEYTVDQAATCTSAGSKSIRCKDCNAVKEGSTVVVDALGHSYSEWSTTTEPTCTTTGTAKRTCSRCQNAESKTLDKKAHDWKEEYTVTQAATCTTAGTKVIKCKDCNTTKSGSTVSIPALGHSYGEWVTTTEPTCANTGIAKHTCSTCQKVESKTLDKKPHDWKEEYTVDQAATCTEAGSKSIHCRDCDAVQEESSETIPALGHSYGDWTTINEPTCTQTGTARRTCRVCRNVETKTLNKKVHDWKEEYTVDQEATCTEAGSKSIHCRDCDAVLEDSETSIPATGHQYGDWMVTKEATCTAAGSKKRICTVCDASQTASIPKLGHNYSAHVVEPTCTQDGYTLYFCLYCNDQYTDNETQALGHDWGEWTTVDTATCTTEGTEQHTCNTCGLTESRNITKADHSWENDYTVDREPTCTVDGSESIHCENCDAVINSKAIPATGHDYTDWVEVSDPTCTQDGKATRSCSKCETEETLVLPALGHELASVTVKASPDKNGYTADECARCKEQFNKAQIVCPKSFTLSNTAFTYNGKACTPAATVKDADGQLINTDHYGVTYSGNVNAGTAKATVTFKGSLFEGSKALTYTIKKAGNPLTVTAKTATVKAKKIKKKKQVLAVSKVLTVGRNQGAVTYVKVSGSKKITINKSTGKVTVKKGLKKGTYKVKVNVDAAGNANYNKATKTAVFKVKVK